MKIALRIVLALALLAGLASPWLLRRSPPQAAPPLPALDATPPSPPEPLLPPDTTAHREESDPAPERDPAPPAPAASVPVPSAPDPEALPESRRVLGRVLDCTGFGVPGVALGLEADGGKVELVSGTGGTFEVVGPPRRGRVVARDARHETVLAGALDPESTAEIVVVVAPRLALAGRVIDAAGAPLEGVGLSVVPRRPLEVSFARTLDGAGTRAWASRSDADGRFEFATAPALPGGALVAGQTGFLPFEMPLPARDARALLVVLERPATSAGVVRGLVLDADGRPVERARVAAHPATTTSDEHG